jgi:hypothetical protein
LLNREEQLIYSSSTQSTEFIDRTLSATGNERQVTILGAKYLRYESLLDNIRYIYLLPYNQVEMPVRNLRTIIICTMLFTLVVGILSIRYLLKMNITPVNDILRLINAGKNEDNEFQVIMQILKNKKSEELQLYNELNAFVRWLWVILSVEWSEKGMWTLVLWKS